MSAVASDVEAKFYQIALGPKLAYKLTDLVKLQYTLIFQDPFKSSLHSPTTGNNS